MPHYLGWGFGSILATKNFVFNYKETEFTLVKDKFRNYFEAEKIIKNKQKSEETIKEIEKTIKSLDLKIFSKKEYYDLMDKINRSPGNIFDFRKMDFLEIKKDYLEFF